MLRTSVGYEMLRFAQHDSSGRVPSLSCGAERSGVEVSHTQKPLLNISKDFSEGAGLHCSSETRRRKTPDRQRVAGTDLPPV